MMRPYPIKILIIVSASVLMGISPFALAQQAMTEADPDASGEYTLSPRLIR